MQWELSGVIQSLVLVFILGVFILGLGISKIGENQTANLLYENYKEKYDDDVVIFSSIAAEPCCLVINENKLLGGYHKGQGWDKFAERGQWW